MKKIFILAVIMAMALGFYLEAHADLSLLGQGTSLHGTYNLIYDSDLDITWYDYSSAKNTWQHQVDWAAALSVTFGSNVYDDWRLPTTVDGPWSYGYDGTTTTGYTITSSEMGHLYYTELGNSGAYDPYGNRTSCGGTLPTCLTNTDDFQNLQPEEYWSGTEYVAYPDGAWYFFFNVGYQNGTGTDGKYEHALAVRPGLAVVPEPISSILFLTGGSLIAGQRYIKRKNSA